MSGRVHAVIIAHPVQDSFTGTLARAYVSAARALGDTVVVRDLYKEGFDPCLKAEEIPGSPDYALGADVKKERALLREAEVFALFYPLWFNGPPAILKGYIDRVFGMGFGFRPYRGSQAPLLKGRKLISFTVSGAPEHWVRETGAFNALYTVFDRHIAAMCGLSILAHLHFGSVVPGYPAQAVRKARDDVKAAVERFFERAADPAT